MTAQFARRLMVMSATALAGAALLVTQASAQMDQGRSRDQGMTQGNSQGARASGGFDSGMRSGTSADVGARAQAGDRNLRANGRSELRTRGDMREGTTLRTRDRFARDRDTIRTRRDSNIRLGTRADRRSFALSSPRFRDDGRRFRRGFRSASVSIGTGFNDYDYPYYNDYAFAGSYPGYYDDYAFAGPRYRSIYAASPACTCGSYGAYGAYGSVGFGWGSGWGWDWR